MLGYCCCPETRVGMSLSCGWSHQHSVFEGGGRGWEGEGEGRGVERGRVGRRGRGD